MSIASALTVMTQRALRAKFCALRDEGAATKCNFPSSQTASSGITWGRPPGFPVANQYVLPCAKRSRASNHDVTGASSALNGLAVIQCSELGIGSVTGSPSDIATST
jgi:hypothetical protein